MMKDRWRLGCALISLTMACGGEGPSGEAGEAEEVPTITEDQVPQRTDPPPRRLPPELEGIEPLPPQFCAAYAELRDAERMLSYGDGDVSADNVDAVISGLRVLAPDAPRALRSALDATAIIYEEERARIVNDEIAMVLIERRLFDDERDLLLQMNVRQDFLSRACPGLDGPTDLPL